VKISLVLGAIWSPLAAAAAFLITYEEYRRHYPDRGPALRHAAETALMTFGVFLVLSLVAGWILGLMMR
jgi:hypothetical protein